MKFFFISLILLFSFWVENTSQKFYTGAEIMKIMEESKIRYELNILDEKIPVPDRTQNVIFNEYYREKIDGVYQIYKYSWNDTIEEYFNAAELNFKKKNPELARQNYLKILEINPKFYKVMTYIAQTYAIQGSYNKAIEYYLKTVESNFIDYMAHWFLADTYTEIGENEKALEEITIAKILNRNNPRLNISFNRIFNLNNLDTANWEFNPQIKIDSIADKHIRIKADSDWLGYSFVKALFRYEPNYILSKNISEGESFLFEEKQCIVAMVNIFKEESLQRNPEFDALNKAIELKMIDEYIVYEIALIDRPDVALQLSEEIILRIKDYVIKVRGKKK